MITTLGNETRGVVNRSVFDTLQSIPKNLEYSFTYRFGTLRLFDHGCTDFSGCIRLFTAIDSDVEYIHVVNDAGTVNVYIKRHGVWGSHRDMVGDFTRRVEMMRKNGRVDD